MTFGLFTQRMQAFRQLQQDNKSIENALQAFGCNYPFTNGEDLVVELLADNFPHPNAKSLLYYFLYESQNSMDITKLYETLNKI